MDAVYGASRYEGGLVFIQKAKALELAATYDALSSKTWGEFRSNATPELLKEVLEMLDLEEEAPSAEEPFDLYAIPAVNDGDWPEWPEQLMIGWVPREILSEYAKVDSSVLNGPFAVLDAVREEQIVAAFAWLGYRCTRDDEVIMTCSGG